MRSSSSIVRSLAMSTVLVGFVLAYQACGEFAGTQLEGVGEFSSLTGDPSLKACTPNNAGHAMIHRLTNEEYDNTVRDLLFVKGQPGKKFEGTSVGPSGFSNDSTALTVGNQSARDYVAAAEALAKEVIASKAQADGPYKKLVSCATLNDACALETIRKLAPRAFRRPVPEADVNRLLAVYKAGGGGDQGLQDTIMAMLIDPKFLFSYINHPSPNDPKAVYLLDGHEMASRLSYFVWQSMPDEELFELARNNALGDPETIKAQVARMVKNPKAKQLSNVLYSDWAKLGQLTSVPGIDEATMADIRNETKLFIEDIVANDRSFLSVVDGDQTFLSSKLATYYGWNTAGLPAASMVRAPIPVAERRGIMTHASILIAHGGGSEESHPVSRGRWYADAIVCEEPPPRPENVPGLNDSAPGEGTIRQRLAIHEASKSCYECHKVMDTFGLALENYDPLGKYRPHYEDAAKTPIDTSGKLPDGPKFNSVTEMLVETAVLPKTRACLAKKMMSYALTRATDSPDDLCVANTLGQQYVTQASSFSELLAHIAVSFQFRAQMGNGGSAQ